MVFIVIIIASFFLQMILPWWIIIIISFATCGLIGKTGKISLWAPFFSILFLWIGMALFKSIPNQHILALRVAEMFGVKSWVLIMMLSAVLGAFCASISGFCGYHFRKAVLKKKQSSN